MSILVGFQKFVYNTTENGFAQYLVKRWDHMPSFFEKAIDQNEYLLYN